MMSGGEREPGCFMLTLLACVCVCSFRKYVPGHFPDVFKDASIYHTRELFFFFFSTLEGFCFTALRLLAHTLKHGPSPLRK